MADINIERYCSVYVPANLTLDEVARVIKVKIYTESLKTLTCDWVLRTYIEVSERENLSDKIDFFSTAYSDYIAEYLVDVMFSVTLSKIATDSSRTYNEKIARLSATYQLNTRTKPQFTVSENTAFILLAMIDECIRDKSKTDKEKESIILKKLETVIK